MLPADLHESSARRHRTHSFQEWLDPLDYGFERWITNAILTNVVRPVSQATGRTLALFVLDDNLESSHLDLECSQS